MKRSVLVSTTAAALLAIAAVPGFAVDPDAPVRGPMPFDDMDTNQDGYVSQEEYRHAHSERVEQRNEEQQRYQYRNMDEAPRYADIDTDHDGRVSREEFQAHQQQRMQQRAQEREDRQQKREAHQQEMMERHQERVEEMQQQRMEMPAGGMNPGGGMGGGKR